MLKSQKAEKSSKETRSIANWDLSSRIEYGAQYMQPVTLIEEESSSVDVDDGLN
jgi:hypothetical protein